MTLIKKIYLLGNPTYHSISPSTQERISRKYQTPITYSLFTSSVHYIYLSFNECSLNGYACNNITIPHKIISRKLNDYSTGFVGFNVTKTYECSILCFNTDVRSCLLQKFNLFKRTKRSLIIGFGGVSKSLHQFLYTLPISSRSLDTLFIINIMLYHLVIDCSSGILQRLPPCNVFTNCLYTVSYTNLSFYMFYYRIISGLKMLLVQATLSFYIFGWSI